jgi:hypothetical protein
MRRAAVRADDIRQMLGLADRTRVIDLFEALMRGDMAKALGELRDQYDSGADPAVVLSDLAEFTHFVTRVKVVPAVADDLRARRSERTRGRAFAAALSMRVLARTWQMLFKGLAEVKEAGKPLAAAEMVLVRIAYAADLPTPDEVIRDIQNGAATSAPAGNGSSGAARPSAAPRYDPPRGSPRASLAPAQLVTAQVPDISALRAEPAAAPTLAVANFPALIALANEKRDILMKSALERDVRLVRFEDGKLEIALEPSARKTIVQDLQRKISEWTGRRWMVVVSSEAGAPTVNSQAAAKRSELEQGVRADPLVQAVLARFPGAEIVGVRRRDDLSAPEAPPQARARCPTRTTMARMTTTGDAWLTSSADEAGDPAAGEDGRDAGRARPDHGRGNGRRRNGDGHDVGQGRPEGRAHRRAAREARRERDHRGPDRCRACGRAPQGRGADGREDERPHRRPAAAAGAEVVLVLFPSPRGAGRGC